MLFVGDVLILIASLWLTLLIRHLAIPSRELFADHLTPFVILFAVWIVIFFIAGLYEKHTVVFQNELPKLLLKTQGINVFIAVLFFYLIPYFGITPKTNLFIYIAVSFCLILAWRLYGFGFLGLRRTQQPAAIIGSGDEMRELRDEVNANPQSGLAFTLSVDLASIDAVDVQRDVIERVYGDGIQTIAVDLRSEHIEPLLPHMYNLIFSHVHFYDMHTFYQQTFDRIPLSLVRYSWFLEHISATPHSVFDAWKRLVDIVLAGAAGLASLLVYPFVIGAIKLDDGGPIFIYQERIGQHGRRIHTTKFRTMMTDDGGKEGGEKKKNGNTRVGTFLRKTRIDELPQLWDVVRGDISLIGPRPELPSLVEHYQSQIPYYDIRHLIKPGLSGWAQLYHKDPPKRDADVLRTKKKLSYDLYYIISRSPFLDLKIALKTLKTLVSRSGT